MLGFIYKKASQEGVKTRLMVDATGDTFGTRGFKSHIGGRDYLQEVVALPNAEAKVYHPHHKKIIDGLLHLGGCRSSRTERGEGHFVRAKSGIFA